MGVARNAVLAVEKRQLVAADYVPGGMCFAQIVANSHGMVRLRSCVLAEEAISMMQVPQTDPSTNTPVVVKRRMNRR